MPLNDDERQDWEARFRKEIEDEFRRRQELKAQADAQRGKAGKEAEDREQELAKIRAAVRESFWKDQGYVRYLDSRGGESWLTPEDYERRMKARKRRKRDDGTAARWSANGKRLAMFAGVVLLAILIGYALGR